MAHILVYWKAYWDYGSDGAKAHVQTKAYGSAKLASVSPGDIIWVVVITSQDDWKIAMQLYVRRLDKDESETSTRFRAVADPDRSHFLEIGEQPDAERLLKRLTFRSGKRIIASGRLIGRSLESPRPLSPDDAKLFVDYCTAFSSGQSEPVLD